MFIRSEKKKYIEIMKREANDVRFAGILVHLMEIKVEMNKTGIRSLEGIFKIKISAVR